MFLIIPSSKERKGKGYIWATATVNKIFSISKLAHNASFVHDEGWSGSVFSGSIFQVTGMLQFGQSAIIINTIFGVYFPNQINRTRPFSV